MSKMTMNGLAVGLFTTVFVWTTMTVGDGDIHTVADFLSGAGNDSYLWGTNLLLIAWAFSLRLKCIAWLVLKIDGAVLLIVHIPKLISEQAMIGQWTLRPDGSSGGFPSGHATHAFAMAFLMSYFFPRLWLLWYSMAASIAWSRLEMSAHTPFQLTVGICFGLAISYGFIRNWRGHFDSHKHYDQAAIKRVA